MMLFDCPCFFNDHFNKRVNAKASFLGDIMDELSTINKDRIR
jgi:hypothetical protein